MRNASVYWLHTPEMKDYFSEGYIGVSVNPEQRLEYHYCTAKKGTHTNPHLINVFEKYNDISHSIILEGPEDYCYEIEEKLRPTDHIGWNIRKGGSGGPDTTGLIMSQEIRDKMSKDRMGEKNNFYGKHHTIETKKKLSEITSQRTGRKNPMFGKKHTNETKQKIKDNHVGMLGKEHSETTKENMRKAWEIRKLNEVSVSVSDETRKRISEAAKNKKRSDTHKANISTSLKGKIRGPYKKKEKSL